ncbi:virion structural protein [Pseudomonas phage Psa21]|uniref:Virion structural protein n=1 Tax=Pseudomonas phage Psa21 TaxID=2530023 RepID=A0A481W4H0_9CAUD|nr:virion structural protein [Pseudomonas phage Psa21]QBJ02709.1 virion structural protein [Pseudomonas phage Psa21]
MYTLVRSRYRADRRSGRWQEADLSNEIVTTLSTIYGDVVLYVEYPGAGKQQLKALKFDNVTTWMNNVSPTATVQEWLTSLGNQTLPFETTLPNETERLVRYAQAWHAGYTAQPKGRNLHINSTASKFVKEDLILTHPTHSYADYDKYCLTTVNGYFHISDYTVDGIRIMDGNRSVRRANNNQIGIYSFETVGALQKVPITAAMVRPQREGAPLNDAAYISMPAGIDIANKTVLLVVGGYLQVLGKVYKPVGDRTWRIEVGASMFLDRYIQSVKELDLDDLGLTIDPKNPTLMSLAQMRSDEVVLKYLTLSQSFFVIVDTPSFFQDYEPIEWLRLPGRFIDPTGDNLPLVGAYGRMLDYHTIHEVDTFVYAGSNNIRHNYDANHRRWTTKALVDGGRYPADPFKHDEAFYRILGTN